MGLGGEGDRAVGLPMTVIDCHIDLQNADHRYDEAEVQRCLALANRAGIDRLVYLFNLAAAASTHGKTTSAPATASAASS